MGILDAFTPEDCVDVKFSQFYELMRESTRAEMMLNAIICDVPHIWIRQMITGQKEDAGPIVFDNSDTTETIGTIGYIDIVDNGDGTFTNKQKRQNTQKGDDS